MRTNCKLKHSQNARFIDIAGGGTYMLNGCTLSSSRSGSGHHQQSQPQQNGFDCHDVRRRSRHAAKLKMGDTNDDIHLCIMCLRAIMNNKVSSPCHIFILFLTRHNSHYLRFCWLQHGFSLVIQSTDAINCIALSLTHKSPRYIINYISQQLVQVLQMNILLVNLIFNTWFYT